jgi:hypothetical protein
MKRPSALARALHSLRAQRQTPAPMPACIGLVIDATASREQTWEQAQQVQLRMFESIAKLKALKLRLVHFGGNALTDHHWQDDPKALARRMAAVCCRSGLTQFNAALRGYAEGEPRAQAVILIGDAFEEDAETAAAIAQTLKAQGTKLFCFIEGGNEVAAQSFAMLARLTGGCFARLGDELPLADLCEGVALLTAGGSQAVAQLKNEKARLLLAGPAK